VTPDERSEIRKIRATLNVLADEEGNDRQMLLEMAEDMLTDLETGDSLVSLDYYIRRYSYQTPDEARDTARSIELMLAQAQDAES